MTQFSQQPKGITQLSGALIVLVIAVLSIGGWYVYDRAENENIESNTILNNGNTNLDIMNSEKNKNTTINTTNTNQSDIFANWLKYNNTDLGFSVLYPPEWTTSTVGADGALNHSAYDAVIREGVCSTGESCNISSGYCGIVIGRLPYPLTIESDIGMVLDDLNSRAKAPIEKISFQDYTAYKTKVSASPSDGDDLLGTYYILDFNTHSLQAYLESGYLKAECDTSIANILSSLNR